MSDSSLTIGVVTDRTSLTDKKIEVQKKKGKKKGEFLHLTSKVFQIRQGNSIAHVGYVGLYWQKKNILLCSGNELTGYLSGSFCNSILNL